LESRGAPSPPQRMPGSGYSARALQRGAPRPGRISARRGALLRLCPGCNISRLRRRDCGTRGAHGGAGARGQGRRMSSHLQREHEQGARAVDAKGEMLEGCEACCLLSTRRGGPPPPGAGAEQRAECAGAGTVGTMTRSCGRKGRLRTRPPQSRGARPAAPRARARAPLTRRAYVGRGAQATRGASCVQNRGAPAAAYGQRDAPRHALSSVGVEGVGGRGALMYLF